MKKEQNYHRMYSYFTQKGKGKMSKGKKGTNLGRWLLKNIKSTGFSQRGFARYTKINPNLLSKYCLGYCYPSLINFFRIIDAIAVLHDEPIGDIVEEAMIELKEDVLCSQSE